jgi:ElaB/YqjD/DUF883 family membrane-anchored ribosome-binding protein
MNRDTERLLDDLRKVIVELEGLLSQPAEHLEEAASDIETTLRGLRHRMTELQAQIERRVGRAVRDADRSLRENPWTTVAIAAAATFLLGLALGHRAPPENPDAE